MSKDFDPEKFCGIEEYGTSSPGVGGKIKRRPEDFRVEETPVKMEEGGDYLLCRLRKTDLSTPQALDILAKKLNVSKGRVGYAGLKDRRAKTEQFITVRNLSSGRAELSVDNLELEPVKRVSRPLGPGDLQGNRFEVVIRDIESERNKCREELERLAEEVEEGVPNYYGLQRFGGDRPVSHLVGKELLRRDFKGAVQTYLFRTFETEREEARRARERLADERDFSQALGYYPENLTYERKLLKRIDSVEPSSQGDWEQVFHIFPENLRRLFVHAYQSYLFNRALSSLLSREEVKNFPAKVPGYMTDLADSDFDFLLEKILDEEEVELEDFRFRDRGELSSKGAVRAALVEPEVKVIEAGEDDENSGRTEAKLSFFLKPGRYATVVLREFMKPS
ncbi:MAG: tRNA pseudouridine(13) synthase TruD [Candidatus Aenigmatarchaeota archaeon]